MSDGMLTRREAILAGAAAAVLGGRASAEEREPQRATTSRAAVRPIKAFCVDFNWGSKGASEPGLYAQADPATHVAWYRDLGVNTIQTFCVSYNGYAWYPSEVAPVNPGLRCPNFLGEMARLGHDAGMAVMGYFTLGANPYWEARHRDLVHGGDSDYIKIPMTLEYLDYFCRSVADAIEKNDVDGFMIDWVRPTQHKNWLACEKEMWRQLFDEPFPVAAPSAEAAVEFDRRALDRAWRHIRWATKATRPVIIWTNHPIIKKEYAIWKGHRILREVDWLLNESPELEHLEWLRGEVGASTYIVQNLCGWKDHDANAWRKVDPKTFGFYGYARADQQTTLPATGSAINAKNIEILRQAYAELQAR